MPRRTKSLTDLAGSGDDGTTALLGGGRARKDDPRIEAYGTVDEASSALGLAKALTRSDRVRGICEDLQRDLYALGAELATNPGQAGKFGAFGEAETERLAELSARLEAEAPMPAGFVLPGATPASGALDLARTIARRAERRVLSLGPDHAGARRWLNRLSLLLFVLARFEEQEAGVAAKAAREEG